MAYKVSDATTGAVYQEVTGFSPRGQAASVSYGNGVTSTYSFHPAMGWLAGSTTSGATGTIQSYNYGFDAVGNATSRSISFALGSGANMAETFGYDNLHRVTSRSVSAAVGLSGTAAMSESYSYDANGNLGFKTSVGYYQYNVSGKPNRLAGVWQNSNFSGTQHYSFSYDANGNVTNDGKRSFTYTAFEKPSRVTQGSDYTDFSYGPNRELLRRVDVRPGKTTSTL